MIDHELHVGEWKDVKYDLRDLASPNFYWMTPPMSAVEWRKILNAMLCILKKGIAKPKQ
jgi:hypothetical protein